MKGRQEIIALLTRKWVKEMDYRLIKELWASTGNRIAVRFAYEWHDYSGNWYRSYGNENWEYNDDGLMRMRFACINDLPIKEADRKYHWPLGRRPDVNTTALIEREMKLSQTKKVASVQSSQIGYADRVHVKET
jgi:nuclear transport factor 2 (NTF2) superfamily protein